jgi:glycosyltransferase 2 family protein
MRGRVLHNALSWGGLLVSAVFAYFAVRNVAFAEVWDGLQSSNYWWLIPAIAALAGSVVVRTVRWRYLFPRETRPAFDPALRASIVGYFFNIVLPARAGEAARVVALNREAGTSMAESAATVVVERAYDVLSLLALLFVTVPWIPHITWLRSAAELGVGLAVALVVIGVTLAVFGVRPLHFVLRPLGRLPFVSAERLEALGESLGRGLAGLRDLRLVAIASVLSMLNLLALTLSVWFVMEGFHLGLSPVAAMLVVVATNLVQILPSSPAALGVFEAATLVALRPYGVSDSDALSYAIVLHAAHVLPFIAVGLLLVGGTLRLQPRAAPLGAEAEDVAD